MDLINKSLFTYRDEEFQQCLLTYYQILLTELFEFWKLGLIEDFKKSFYSLLDFKNKHQKTRRPIHIQIEVVNIPAQN